MTDDRPAIIIAATPTPNGDLHVGHLAGPYLAGDVYARYLRASGRAVSYTTCTDDSQSYVLTSAFRRGTDPRELCAESTAAIGSSLTEMGISIEPLPPIDERYTRCVQDFVSRLQVTGRLRAADRPAALRRPGPSATSTTAWSPAAARSALAGSCGGVCEDCGHPNNFDQLLDASSTLDPADAVIYRAGSGSWCCRWRNTASS